MSSRRWAFNLAPERPKDDIVKPVGFVDDSKLVRLLPLPRPPLVDLSQIFAAASIHGNF